MKFIADSMLGRLARWLRLLGYDTLYYPRIEDTQLLKIAREEDRILLTKDTHLVRRRGLRKYAEYNTHAEADKTQITYFLLNENNPFEQLKTVISNLKLKDFSLMSRCAVCNALIAGITKENVKDLVPEYVFQTSEDFKQCQGCKKLYWEGTHPEKFRKKLSEILGTA
ncbi:MAG: Mut7-C RNAse domain-containing protein [Nitrospirae bacterium]|nr:Mut7-C RNAse domain-containing protein [Nitrospirota bacterium]